MMGPQGIPRATCAERDSPELRASQAARPLAPPILADPSPGPIQSLLHLVYDVLWAVLLLLSAPWWALRALRDPQFGEGVRGRLGAGWPRPPVPGERERILVHGVSVGEVKAAREFVRLLEERHPDLEVVLSTTTATGWRVARDLYPGHTVVRFPVDFSPLVRRFLGRVAPVCAVLVELEIWPNFLRTANRRSIPVAVVNGRITKRSYGKYVWVRNLMPQFDRISLFCVQDEIYARRFEDLAGGDARILVTGNIKADALRIGRVEPPEKLRRLLAAPAGTTVLVAGSTHEPEERWIAAAWRQAAPEGRLILVPRHPDRAEAIVQDLAREGTAPQRLSALRGGEPPDPRRPAIVDTIGELEAVYALADLVFVGGSLIPHGGQNMLEPAAQGIAVLYGPHVENFAHEAALLEQHGAARRIAGRGELVEALAELVRDPVLREEMAAAGLAAALRQRGAAQRTLAALECGCLRPKGGGRVPGSSGSVYADRPRGRG